MSDYEKQIVTLIKYKAGEYEDRQDYLASLVRAADKWLQKHDSNGDIFDGWDNELAGWFDDAVHAMNAKKSIPDFPDAELEDEVPNEALTEENEPSDEMDPDDGQAPIEETGDVVSASPTEDTTSDEQVAEEVQSEDTPPKENKPKYRGKIVTRYDNIDGSRDRFGVVIGTKTHEVVKLYEQGTTSAEIEQKVGGRHYNILHTLAKKGHRVEKIPSGGYKLTHKDDLREPE